MDLGRTHDELVMTGIQQRSNIQRFAVVTHCFCLGLRGDDIWNFLVYVNLRCPQLREHAVQGFKDMRGAQRPM